MQRLIHACCIPDIEEQCSGRHGAVQQYVVRARGEAGPRGCH